MPSSGLLAELAARGLIHDSTDLAALGARLEAGPVTLYCGLDPTGASLHLGNLQQLLLLRRFQLAGHRPLALVGGATGLIGDPGGKSEERPLLPAEVVAANVEAIAAQMARLLDVGPGPTQARVVDNLEWTAPMSAIEFLRDVGKHLTVNVMMAKDSVRSRLERESGISFTEFAYMLLQANDFYVLWEREGCELQVAGSDQWGNITAGIELIRRRAGATVHGLTSPLLLRPDGTKFGKSESGAIWLDPAATSPFRFFQFFMRVEDDEVDTLLRRFTFVPLDEIDAVVAAHRAAPQRREGQRRLAREVTAVVHGEEVLGPIEAASAVLFGSDPTEAPAATFELLAAEIPTSTVPRADLDAGLEPAELLVRAGVAPSKGAVRRQPEGFTINGRRVADLETVAAGDLRHDRWLLLRKGKADHHLVEAIRG